ncbi:MAG: phosphate/phosphite/phosphonate ABC transporter substrate-binding protein [Planctomycetaceae bacterium]|nr:phosphate/phosphite/phosphonate ABC transporter substrate-binding protein [Planctomycetaceae bacterium]
MAPHPLAYHPRVPEEVAAKVKAAIIEMTNSEEGRTLLAGIPMTKPVTATDEDYQSLVDLKLEEFYQAPE